MTQAPLFVDWWCPDCRRTDKHAWTCPVMQRWAVAHYGEKRAAELLERMREGRS